MKTKDQQRLPADGVTNSIIYLTTLYTDKKESISVYICLFFFKPRQSRYKMYAAMVNYNNDLFFTQF